MIIGIVRFFWAWKLTGIGVRIRLRFVHIFATKRRIGHWDDLMAGLRDENLLQ